MQIQKEVLFILNFWFILFAQEVQDFTLVLAIFINIDGKIICKTSDSDSFFLLAGPIKLIKDLPYFLLCFSFSVLLLWSYVCAKFNEVAPLSSRIIIVYYRLKFFRSIFKVYVILQTFWKVPKLLWRWSPPITFIWNFWKNYF